MTRVVRGKLLGEGRFHGQLKFRNAKLLPFPGMSGFLLCRGTLRTQEGQTLPLYVVLCPPPSSEHLRRPGFLLIKFAGLVEDGCE